MREKTLGEQQATAAAGRDLKAQIKQLQERIAEMEAVLAEWERIIKGVK
jgi:uncharacterized protein YaiL (DUF2058 family)